MKTKFAKSNVQISGNIEITTTGNMGNNTRVISINPLKTGKSGIYGIRNKFNGRLYIGKARDLENRYNRHMRDLLKNEHCNKLIQDDWSNSNLFNPESLFEFEVIIYCYPSQLTFWENILIKQLNPYYNIASKQKELTYEDVAEAEKFYSDNELEDVEND